MQRNSSNLILNIDINFFLVNKDFNSRMFFNSNNIEYITARKKLESVKAEDDNKIIYYILKYM